MSLEQPSIRVNQGRKFTTQAPAVKITLTIADEITSRLDASRGLQSRNAWIREACEEKLAQEQIDDLDRLSRKLEVSA